MTSRLLVLVAAAHAMLALACLPLLAIHAPPILGDHPALKPLRFAVAIALFLAALAVLLPRLAAPPIIERVLAVTLSTEMLVIALQALRGRRSHFNTEAPLDAAVVAIMFVGIAALVIAMAYVTVLAWSRSAGDELMTWAWRAALALFWLGVGSGIAMGGRARHTIGAPDGGPGLPVTSWSTGHGDLRVTHFVALHALQIFPLAAAGIARLPLGPSGRGVVLAVVIASVIAVVVWTWCAALAGQPLWRGLV